MTAPAELDRIERQLAAALHRAREMAYQPEPSELEPVHESPTYRELERLSTGTGRTLRCAPSYPQAASALVEADENGRS